MKGSWFENREEKRKVNYFVRDYVIILDQLGWALVSTQRSNLD